MPTQELEPGMLVRVHQEVDRREGNWANEIVGTVVEVFPAPTGSWHAHGKDDKLWLNRIRLKKPDGEITTLILDDHTRVEVLGMSRPL
jgi:hypothetical protein